MRPVVLTALAILGAYALLVALASWRQEELLYLPARVGIAAVLSPSLQAWPAADDFRGLVAEPDHATATAIVF